MALKKQALPLESDPEIFTSLIHGLGVSRSLSFIDVYSLDDLGNFSIPRPVLGLILVYPTAADYEDEIHQYQRAARGSSGDDIDCIWFKQTIHNACGFYAILHTLTNGIARSLIERDSVLAGLVQKCRHLNSDEISHEIENSEVIGRIYRNAAEQGSTAPPAEGEEVDYHYVALSKLEKGNIVELDGDLGGPVVTNVRLDPEQDLLSGAGVQFMKDFISSRTDAGQGFSLLALVQT